MRYMGGKSRISKQISEVINNAVYGRKVQNIQANSRNYQSCYELGGGEHSQACFVVLALLKPKSKQT